MKAVLFLFLSRLLYSVAVSVVDEQQQSLAKSTVSLSSFTAAASSFSPTMKQTKIPTKNPSYFPTVIRSTTPSRVPFSTFPPTKKTSNPSNLPHTISPTFSPSKQPISTSKAPLSTSSPTKASKTFSPSKKPLSTFLPTPTSQQAVTWVVGPYLQNCNQICSLGGAQCIPGVNYGNNDIVGLSAVLANAIDYSTGNCGPFQGACSQSFQESLYYTSYYIPGTLNGFCAVGKPVDCTATAVHQIYLYSNVCSCTSNFGC
mmetsp:Transcript_18346/g.25168  ORF Transcript_18346/g.25168 Transcript_18346/m.25168 type:complete len:258 (-) Transcript_18346:24-797(-)